MLHNRLCVCDRRPHVGRQLRRQLQHVPTNWAPGPVRAAPYHRVCGEPGFAMDFNAKDIRNVVTGRQYFLSQPDHDMNVTDGSSFCWLSLRQTKSGFILPKCFKAEA